MTSSYFKYAIGEIALVVIGILIALTINNWNENRKVNKELKGYLSSIQKNLRADIESIKIINKNYKNASSGAKMFMQQLLQDNYTIEGLMAVGEVLGEEYVTVDQSGFEALKNSGYISKLQGTDIEDALFKYYGHYQVVLRAEQSYNNFVERMEANLYGMNELDMIDANKIFNQENYDNISPISQPLDRLIPKLSTNSYLIGMMNRAADEDTDQYDLLLNFANELFSKIDNALNN